MTGTRWAQALVATVALWWGPAHAHKNSDATLHWQVQGTLVHQRVDIALRDLDRDLVLDANDDGQLSWGEVRSHWPQIEALLANALTVRANGQACTPEASAAPQLAEHGDGPHAVLQHTLNCPAPVRQLSVDYRLFQATDAGHRGLMRVSGAIEHSAVLVPGAGPQPFGTGLGRSFQGFVAEGVHHIAVGWDHLLFLASLLMVAVWQRSGASGSGRSGRPATWEPRPHASAAWGETLRLVTAFTLAHSVTLGLAATGVLAPPSRWVESLIALSVLVAALDNLRPFLPGPRWAMAATFGLVHGFGFAGPLQDMGLRHSELAVALLGFNLGVELGQLALVLLLLPLACAARAAASYRHAVVRPGSTAIAGVSLVWVAERALAVTLWP